VRIFVAGASGVIGARLVPLLVADGHVAAGVTRSAGNAGLGAEPIVADVFDADAYVAGHDASLARVSPLRPAGS
jgi:uncharacterized protein YbjT (DUF2867 family)